MDIVYSKNNVPIRLNEERWVHIVENHDDVAGYYDEILNTLEEPDYIIKGYKEALIALKSFEGKLFLSVVYKEASENDGFVITAYFTSKIKLDKEEILWQKK